MVTCPPQSPIRKQERVIVSHHQQPINNNPRFDVITSHIRHLCIKTVKHFSDVIFTESDYIQCVRKSHRVSSRWFSSVQCSIITQHLQEEAARLTIYFALFPAVFVTLHFRLATVIFLLLIKSNAGMMSQHIGS